MRNIITLLILLTGLSLHGQAFSPNDGVFWYNETVTTETPSAAVTNLTWAPTNILVIIKTNASTYSYNYPQYKAANIQDKDITVVEYFGSYSTNQGMTSINFGPSLTNVSIFIQEATNLTSIVGSSPSTLGDGFFNGNTRMTTFALTNLTTSAGTFDVGDCTALSYVSLPVWTPAGNDIEIHFHASALTVTSVNHILARCAAGTVENSSISLSGGTSAAPTGQGITDVGTLEGRGNTVETN